MKFLSRFDVSVQFIAQIKQCQNTWVQCVYPLASIWQEYPGKVEYFCWSFKMHSTLFNDVKHLFESLISFVIIILQSILGGLEFKSYFPDNEPSANI